MELLHAKKITADRVVLDPMEAIDDQQHDQDRRIWCAEGSLSVSANGKPFSLQPGDTLNVPANTSYQITAGLSGCAFYTA